MGYEKICKLKANIIEVSEQATIENLKVKFSTLFNISSDLITSNNVNSTNLSGTNVVINKLNLFGPSAAPTNSNSPGTVGEIRWDNLYLYIYTTNAGPWRRISLGASF